MTADQLGSEDEETIGGRELLKSAKIKIERDEVSNSGMRLIVGHCGNRKVELVLDGDGRIFRGKCGCSHHFKNALRKGPCRHLQAIRNQLLNSSDQPSTLARWYDSFWN